MNEKEIVERLGPPDEIVRRENRMRRRAWMCSTCRELTVWDEAVPCPAPCARCGGIVFEAKRPLLQ